MTDCTVKAGVKEMKFYFLLLIALASMLAFAGGVKAADEMGPATSNLEQWSEEMGPVFSNPEMRTEEMAPAPSIPEQGTEEMTPATSGWEQGYYDEMAPIGSNPEKEEGSSDSFDY
jgi:hypothetical protein